MNKFCIGIISLACLLFSCQENLEKEEVYAAGETGIEAAGPVRSGWVRMKFKDMPQEMEQLLASGKITPFVAELNKMFTGVKATEVKRVFPFAGQYEERSQREGLHLWYDVYFEDLPGVKGMSSVQTDFLFGIACIEPEYRVKLLDNGPVIPLESIKTTAVTTAELPFNDQYLDRQWHYFNDGSLADAVAGADIHVAGAWEEHCNSSDVVVAVVDQGVDFSHIELEGNAFVNKAELEGMPGIDDDNNGFIDDIYGWNFVNDSPEIIPGDHGTHVAGVVGAENNNGIGVCGVAGGYGGHTGSKLISCQIIDVDGKTAANVPAAIKYAADRGALICQNSWVLEEEDEFPESLKEAIDYFVKYAGTDKNGRQTARMKGGLVVFAAGNQNVKKAVYPSCYEKVLAVSAFAPDFTKTYYSNYDTWVDIAAPGGSKAYNGKYSDDHMILSTVLDNKIGYLEGTSMAAPQVSGIAALLVAKFGGIGFTSEHLKARLLSATNNIDQYNPDYAGCLGVGYIDATKAFSKVASVVTPVSNLNCIPSPGRILVKWEGHPDSETYQIYWSTEDFSDLGNLPSDCKMAEVSSAWLAGEQAGYELEALQPGTEYYVAVIACDRFGNHSELVKQKTTVLPNQSPLLIRQGNGPVVLPYRGNVRVEFQVSDPEGHRLEYTLEDETGCASVVQAGNTVWVELNYKAGIKGEHTVGLIVRDEYGGQTSATFVFMVGENQAPVLKKQIEDLWFEVRNTTETIDLSAVFEDPEHEVLTYELEYDPQIVYLRMDNDRLYVSPVRFGLTTVKIRATDTKGLSETVSFKVMVRDGTKRVELYPNPVTDRLNIRMGKEANGEIKVKIYAQNGSLVLEDNLQIAPFRPGVLDVKGLSGGQYSVVVEYGGEKMTANVIKL